MEENNFISSERSQDFNSEFLILIQKIWTNRKFVIKITIISMLIGIVISLLTPNYYTATCTMVPQTSSKNAVGSLGGLAAMAGINLNNIGTGETLSPSVYPKIMSNIEFQKELIYTKYHFKKINEPITLYEYYSNIKYHNFSLIKFLKKYTIGLPGIIFKVIKSKSNKLNQPGNSQIQSITIKEKDVLKELNKNISIAINVKDGYVFLSTSMTDPYVAAELAQKTQELIQKYLTEFKIEKVASNLKFIEQNYEESKKNFEAKQSELAKFRDANKNFSSSVAKTQEEKLNSEYNLLLSIYSELAKQKEQAKIAVKETTPVLTIIEPVYVPIEKSNPNRILILCISIIFGIIISSCVIFIYHFYDIKSARVLNKLHLYIK